MLRASFEPSAAAALSRLREDGCVVVAPDALATLAGSSVAALSPMHESWSRLPPDPHLRDGGKYRARRHSCFLLDPRAQSLSLVAPRPHWQPIDYNALHGGFERWFEPMESSVTRLASFAKLVSGLGAVFAEVTPVKTWHVEAHQFRIDTQGGVGRPTPEGAHRDGVDFVAVIFVGRASVKGGETRVFEADGPNGIRFTLVDPWSALLLDDARVIHETSPLQPVADGGFRDTLVLTYRGSGFQERDGR